MNVSGSLGKRLIADDAGLKKSDVTEGVEIKRIKMNFKRGSRPLP